MSRLRRPAVLVPLAVGVVVLGAAAFAVPAVRGGDATLRGLPTGPLDAAALQSAQVQIHGGGHPSRLLVDGRLVARSSGAPLVHTLGALPEGTHTLVTEVDRGFPRGTVRTERKVVVDTTPPQLRLDAIKPVGIKDKVTVTGQAPGAVRLYVGDREVQPGKDDRFSVGFDTPPAGQQLVALDAAGNRAVMAFDVPVAHPGMRAVHLTALAWTAKSLREPVLALAKAGKIDTVELDIKDESGEVGYDSQVPLAKQIGASKGYYDARKALAQLHGMHVRVVGRLVAFRDPMLAPWASQHGHKDWVIQAPDGSPYQSRYGGFTNFASPSVRAYNVDIAVEAAKLGFDDVLYDYCRRPDGKLSTMRFPGLKETPSQSIAGFMRESRAALRPLGVYVGASVFGIAADRPDQIAQNVPMMGRYVDFVAPMVYPSHWGAGEYGVSNPNSSPGPIVERSLKVFQKDLKGTTVAVTPWLQDFSLGVHYGPAEVKAQIDAAKRDGIDSFLLWNAGAKYQGAALTANK